jgi:hypothetical protein
MLGTQLPAEQVTADCSSSKVGAARLFGYKDSIHAT